MAKPRDGYPAVAVSQAEISNRILTIPNVISFIRLAAIPLFWWLLLAEENVSAAAVLFAVIASTDWLDGYLARRLGQVSKLGKSLDPVADRLMIASAVIAGMIAGVVPTVIGITIIAREIYMAIVTFVVMARKGGVLDVRWLGKLATFLVYGSIGSFYLAAIDFLPLLARPVAWVTGVAGVILYWVTALQYTGDARTMTSKLESTPSPEES